MAATTINVCTVRRRLPASAVQHPRHPQDVHQDHRASHSQLQALAKVALYCACAPAGGPFGDRLNETTFTLNMYRTRHTRSISLVFMKSLERLDTNFLMASPRSAEDWHRLPANEVVRNLVVQLPRWGHLRNANSGNAPLGEIKAGKTLWDQCYHISMQNLKPCTI